MTFNELEPGQVFDCYVMVGSAITGQTKSMIRAMKIRPMQRLDMECKQIYDCNAISIDGTGTLYFNDKTPVTLLQKFIEPYVTQN